jgi:hypothetical protein
MENGDINDISFSQDISISHAAKKRPLEWLLDIYSVARGGRQKWWF